MTKMAKKKIITEEKSEEIFAEMSVVKEETPTEQPQPIVKSLKNFTKFVRQPDVELAIDPILAQILRDVKGENDELQRQIAENNRVLTRGFSKILMMNAVGIRQGCLPMWKEGTDILVIPIPDVMVQKVEEED
jgi:hypothetical protein